MSHPVIKAALGLAVSCFLASPALAVPVIPPSTTFGEFVADDDVQEIEFSIATDSIVTIETISYAGGTTLSFGGLSVPAGGFDPILTLFDDSGTFIAENDDGTFNFDPVTGAAFDSFLQPVLAAGTYRVAITQFSNFFNGGIGDNISLGFSQTGNPNFTDDFFGCAAGQFCDVTGASRTNQFAVNISAQSIPEPSVLALIGFGLVGVGLAYRRRQFG